MSELNEAITESRDLESRLATIKKLLDKADRVKDGSVTPAEADALTEKAAELMARYGVDRAMLAQADKASDPVVDEVVITERPFAELMANLLWGIAYPMRAEARWIRRFNKDLHGGRSKGAYEYGLRIFAHQSDLMRIKLMYASVRNQAIAGMSEIKGYERFGQDQKADRQSYLEGFTHAVSGRVRKAEAEAEAARKAEDDVKDEAALLEGRSRGASVELVLADRRAAVKVAADLAYGITPEDRARWARQAEEDRKAREAEREELERKYESGELERPKPEKIRRGRAPRYYERTGTRYSDGYRDGRDADLGIRPDRSVGERPYSKGEIGR